MDQKFRVILLHRSLRPASTIQNPVSKQNTNNKKNASPHQEVLHRGDEEKMNSPNK